jgi:hypothetical protein
MAPSGIRCSLSIRSRCSDRSNFGKPLDCALVVPADGGFPCGRRLRGDVMRAALETGGVVGQHQVKVGDVDVRLVPVDQRDPIGGQGADVARVVGVAMDDAYLTTDATLARCRLRALLDAEQRGRGSDASYVVTPLPECIHPTGDILSLRFRKLVARRRSCQAASFSIVGFQFQGVDTVPRALGACFGL